MYKHVALPASLRGNAWECFCRQVNSQLETSQDHLDPKIAIPTGVPPYSRHAVLLTAEPHTQWSSDLHEFEMVRQQWAGEGVLFNVARDSTPAPGRDRVLLMPEGKIVSALRRACGGAEDAEPCGRRDWAFVCAHRQRDARCGIVADRILQEYRGPVPLLPISHVGGHKFAGNLIYYRAYSERETHAHWFSKVSPDNIQYVIDSMRRNEIVTELHRGGRRFFL